MYRHPLILESDVRHLKSRTHLDLQKYEHLDENSAAHRSEGIYEDNEFSDGCDALNSTKSL